MDRMDELMPNLRHFEEKMKRLTELFDSQTSYGQSETLERLDELIRRCSPTSD